MLVNGNLSVAGLLQNVKIDRLAADPVTPALSQVWFHTGEAALKYYDGVEVQTIAKGGNLDDYLNRDGSNAMTGVLTLSSDDQSGEAATAATSKGYVDAGLGTKQDTLTGAVTSVTDTDLTASAIVVSDASGKLAASTTATAAEVEYLAGVTSGIQAQIDGKEDELGYVPLDSAGDSMSGNLAMGGNAITGLAAATDSTSPVRKGEFDLAISGIGKDYAADVHGIQEDATLDPGTPVEGDRYIITNSADLHANFGTITGLGDDDIVEFDGAEFVIDFDADVDEEGVLAWDQGNGVYVRWDGSAWSEFGGLAGVTAGIGLEKTGNTIDVLVGAGLVQLPSDDLGVDFATAGGLFTTEDGTTESTAATAQLAIKLDGSTLAVAAAGVKVAAGGITETELNASVVGNGLQGAAGTALSVQTAAESGITVDGTGVSVDDTEMRTRALYRDGAEAMTGELTLSSDDQSASGDLVAVSKGYMNAQIAAQAGNAVGALEDRVEAGYFLYEEVTTPDTSHTVTHNMNQKYVQVSVVDDTDEVIIPDSVTFTDSNSLVVTLATASLCRVVVTGLNTPV